MNQDFFRLKKEMMMSLPVMLPNGLRWRLEYVEPNEWGGDYYHFYECDYINGKIKSFSGFSSPDYDYFKRNLKGWIKSYKLK